MGAECIRCVPTRRRSLPSKPTVHYSFRLDLLLQTNRRKKFKATLYIPDSEAALKARTPLGNVAPGMPDRLMILYRIGLWLLLPVAAAWRPAIAQESRGGRVRIYPRWTTNYHV